MSDFAKHTPYQDQKKAFDDSTMSYVAKRIFQDVKDSDAFKEGIIDGIGNEVKDEQSWAFTNFDRFILAIKQRIGEDNLRDLLSVYENHTDYDPLRIINSTSKAMDAKELLVLKKIVSKVESLEYLPDGSEPTGDFLADSNDSMETRISKSFTLLTVLLHTIRTEHLPTSIEFPKICTNVEATFHVRAFTDYTEIMTFIKDNRLFQFARLTDNVIRTMVATAKDMIDGNVLATSEKSENQGRNWKQLAGAADGKR